MVDQLLEKTGALELQQRRIERLNRTLEVLSAVNALIVRAGDRQALLDEACRIAVEKGGFRLAAIGLIDGPGQAHAPGRYGGRRKRPARPRAPQARHPLADLERCAERLVRRACRCCSAARSPAS
jgi:hypothetical protein